MLYWNGHRVMGVLAMSRAIGDHGLRPYVIPEPEVCVQLPLLLTQWHRTQACVLKASRKQQFI